MARKPPLPVIDKDALDALALTYAARYATTRARLCRYLARKVRERGWSDPKLDSQPMIDAVADRMVALRFVDDEAFAVARAGSMARRGYGGRRIRADLAAAGIAREISAKAVDEDEDSRFAAALAFARRRRFGPFSAAPPDLPAKERQLRAFIRAGHDFTIARQIVALDAEFVQDA